MAEQVSNRIQTAREALAENSNPLNGKTPAQADAYIEANVTNLATAKIALKLIVRLLMLIFRRLDVLEEQLNRTQ
jgi:hypothetical protein